jgi:DNA-binding transcriptional LysR family regulator
VSLLRRATRRVTLTTQGREYFHQCREPLTLLEEVERGLTRGSRDFSFFDTLVYRGHGIGLPPSIYCDSVIAHGRSYRLVQDCGKPPEPRVGSKLLWARIGR